MKDKIKKGWSNTKEWCKKHKKALIIVGGTVVGIVIFKKVVKLGRALYITDWRVDDTLSDPKFVAIDEDIFSDLAINIEEAVLSKDIEHAALSKIYDLGDVVRKVAVTIDNV